MSESMEKQKNLDDEFVERLKKFNTMDDDTEWNKQNLIDFKKN